MSCPVKFVCFPYFNFLLTPILHNTTMILNLLARFYRKLGFIGIHVTYVRRCKRDGVPTVVIVESVFPNDGWVSLILARRTMC